MTELKQIIEIALSGFWQWLGFITILLATQGLINRLVKYVISVAKNTFPGLFK